MVEVEDNLRMLPAERPGILHCTLGHIAEKDGVGIVARPLRNLEDYRRLGVGSGLDDGLQLLHVVEIECGYCISAVYGLGEHLFGVDQTQTLVICHDYYYCIIGFVLSLSYMVKNGSVGPQVHPPDRNYDANIGYFPQFAKQLRHYPSLHGRSWCRHPLIEATIYGGRPFVSRKIRPIYSPIMPSDSNWIPPRNSMTHIRVGYPATGSP